jgi:hypothetical protein
MVLCKEILLMVHFHIKNFILISMINLMVKIEKKQVIGNFGEIFLDMYVVFILIENFKCILKINLIHHLIIGHILIVGIKVWIKMNVCNYGNGSKCLTFGNKDGFLNSVTIVWATTGLT